MIWLAWTSLLLWWLLFHWIDRGLINHPGSNAEPPRELTSPGVNVLIAARNEAERIQRCLNSLLQQHEAIEKIIVVNDHSEDHTASVVKQAGLESGVPILLIDQDEGKAGKKAALLAGLPHVDGNWLYLCDADTWDHPSLLQMLDWASKAKKTVVTGSVRFEVQNFWHQLLDLEQFNNQAVMQGSAGHERPIMANGANLLMRQQHFGQYAESLNNPDASGDDVFFVQSVTAAAVGAPMGLEYCVTTAPPAGLKSLMHQRLRWASKTPNYPSAFARGVGAYVAGLNIVFSVAPWMLIWVYPSGWQWSIGWLWCKWLIEATYHRRWHGMAGMKWRVIPSVLLSLVYPYYVIFVAVMMLIGMPYEWKGRRWKSSSNA